MALRRLATREGSESYIPSEDEEDDHEAAWGSLGSFTAGDYILSEDDADDSGEESRVTLGDLKVGQKLNGIVTKVMSWGCFVDVGLDREGLVHVTRLTQGYLDEASRVVHVGMAVKVWVLDVSEEENKLDLSLLEEDAASAGDDVREGGGGEDGSVAANLASFLTVKPEEWLDGVVDAIFGFGLIVSVTPPDGGPPVQGLVHVSRIRDGFVEDVAQECSVGQEIRVRVESVKGAKLQLTMREPDQFVIDPQANDLSGFMKVSPSLWLEGRVLFTKTFGIFVEVEPPGGGAAVIGMVHVSKMGRGFVRDAATLVEIGQLVRVRVIDVDVESGRVSLSMTDPEE